MYKAIGQSFNGRFYRRERRHSTAEAEILATAKRLRLIRGPNPKQRKPRFKLTIEQIRALSQQYAEGNAPGRKG